VAVEAFVRPFTHFAALLGRGVVPALAQLAPLLG